jgi:Flp pilus assembly protein TadB
MSALDHHDTRAIDEFAARVDAELDEHAASTPLWPLIAAWVAVGGVLTLAQAADAGWLFVIGLAGVVFWVVGFLRARRPHRWWSL